MVNYTALNESETSGGSECVQNRSDDGDIETDPVITYSIGELEFTCFFFYLIYLRCMIMRLHLSSFLQSKDAIYVWDSVVRSQVIGAFFYGYIVTQVPGGR